jgi:hypothetical protein
MYYCIRYYGTDTIHLTTIQDRIHVCLLYGAINQYICLCRQAVNSSTQAQYWMACMCMVWHIISKIIHAYARDQAFVLYSMYDPFLIDNEQEEDVYMFWEHTIRGQVYYIDIYT